MSESKFPEQLKEVLNQPAGQSRAINHIQQKTASFQNADLKSPHSQSSQAEFQKNVLSKMRDYENSLNMLRQQN
jgi:hypothetical protein